ncbi:MAG TPA: hypothetical protein VF690_10315 [Hymenobacter sp.]|jgi:hypothetical protein
MAFLPSTQADEICFTTTTEQARRRLVNNALKLTDNTSLAAGPYERLLLDRFVRGELTIDQVLTYLEDPSGH